MVGKIEKILCALLRFFLPINVRSIKGALWFLISRFSVFFLTLIIFFSIVPVPYSAYMIEKKVTSLWDNKTYNIQYQWVNLENIAWQMQMAAIASEDQRFKEHYGIDFNAIQSALNHNQQSQKIRGASTISQQMVKNLFLWSDRSWIRKAMEIPLTFGVEAIWDKRRILEVYLNIAEFGNGIFGVEAASLRFFKKHANQLNIKEATLLAASLPNPHIFKVNKPGKIMRKKQRWIIKQIRNLGATEYLNQLK
ncbi:MULTISPECIES: monofunctional biosynthetic peptidoglycan transglycosylase [Pasteurellaceae]|uniref:Biosynthetic peptidoglycan transglycosylase n=1 Tax=Pasteurella atlantica TaxID=2827233 RepID=A0AAW8CJK3_9PAST|nr:monofunctional biosynthetic peptidoglycan transglycosylase [Pasteurella atlantica]MBR0573230.1 monofunctional biosynthetic peptidoglycan transglycosylase [Pasteurella atlantica]MDP8041247.1 monofunctional biosynthetic peptidoglycan transglycosylase [Pasteurella atlantica]MDP8043384.1 monofunctional biosynthetic peptidoglycan transglycosylase [Pasteurella atlantica]MDP8061320.1 monofunctional biosynthetic peptidoglycan transglycosylase [Pasteurella atlantica]MDP8089021.1 monofunctional biosy